MQRRFGRLTLAVVLLGVTLLLLGGGTVAAFVALRGAAERVDVATEARMRWSELGDAVAREAFAEAAYRRAPSPEARTALVEAVTGVTVEAEVVRAAGGPQDRSLVSYLLVLNRRYADEVRRTLDTPRSQLADDRVAGPALEAIEALIAGAEDGRQRDLDAARQDRGDLLDRLALLLPAVFLVALLALAGSIRQVVREHRRIARKAAVSESRALSDPLTGLGNREALRRLLDTELEAGSGTVLLVDLDRFKPVNDTYGHEAGDVVLVETAQRLARLVGPGRTAIRLGGDEFAVLAPGVDDPGFLGRRIVHALGAPVEVAGATVTVGASVGAATYPADGLTQQEILRAADLALYAAKAAGRGCLRVYAAVPHAVAERGRDADRAADRTAVSAP